MNNLPADEVPFVRIDNRSEELHQEYFRFRDNLMWATSEIAEEDIFRSWSMQKISVLQIICENLAEECERQRLRLALFEVKRKRKARK